VHNFSVLNEVDQLPTSSSRLLSCNAYTGAFSIARALQEGAQIIVTGNLHFNFFFLITLFYCFTSLIYFHSDRLGRVVDSAIVLGPLIHEFHWKISDFDLLAAGSIAGI
jgi:hypothetical protein